MAGGISVEAADAIRRGLGSPDAGVTADQLRAAAERLVDQAASMSGVGVVTPEALLKAARQARSELDLDAVERGEKKRAALRYVRVWRRDGMSGGSWAIPDEDGGIEIATALKLLVAKTTGGPRFADASKRATDSAASANTGSTPDGTTTGVDGLVTVEDDRSPEQVMADGFVQIVHNGITADPSVVPGGGRAAVRVIVTHDVLTHRVEYGPEAERIGSGILEDSLAAISFGKLEQYLCEGGSTPVRFNDDGTIDVGREQRLFTRLQRIALAVRDGGCRFPGCTKPPSWTEAHHIDQWAKDTGRTDIINGILLCRYHHMLIHNRGWQIHRAESRDPAGSYRLQPPKDYGQRAQSILMPSKNPLLVTPEDERSRSA